MLPLQIYKMVVVDSFKADDLIRRCAWMCSSWRWKMKFLEGDSRVNKISDDSREKETHSFQKSLAHYPRKRNGALTTGERYRTISTKPRRKPSNFEGRGWLVMTFINGFVMLASICGSCGIKALHDKYFEKFTLLDSYDQGSFLSLIVFIYLTCAVISFMGILILCVAQNRNRRGRMRYMIYAYVGWTAALCVLLVGISIQCIAVIFAVPNLFKV